MATFADVRFRDCTWCGTINIAMDLRWSDRFVTGTSVSRSWALMTCPRCAGATLIEIELDIPSGPPGHGIPESEGVHEVNVLPRNDEVNQTVRHLPDDVAEFFNGAQRVLVAGVPDAAAVQLRKTLEAAAAHKEVKEKTLYASVEKLIELNFITKDFAQLLNHVRKIGNLGAHYTDEKIGQAEVLRAMRFTTQVLRNLFEVPGELSELNEETPIPSPTVTESEIS